MEHRWRSRNETCVPVLLYLDNERITEAQVRNISPGGMLLETDSAELKENRVLHVIWISPWMQDDDMSFQKLFIVHSDGNRAGTMFIGDEIVPRELDDLTFRWLHDGVHAHQRNREMAVGE